MLNRLSSSRGSPWCFYFFERIRFQDFFYFFVEKTLLLMKNQHFIIIITFHQITHQLVLSIFTWDFIFSSKFSLWKHHSQKNFPPAAGSSRSLRSQSPIRYVSWPKICLRWRKSDPPLYEHPRTAPLGSAGALGWTEAVLVLWVVCVSALLVRSWGGRREKVRVRWFESVFFTN